MLWYLRWLKYLARVNSIKLICFWEWHARPWDRGSKCFDALYFCSGEHIRPEVLFFSRALFSVLRRDACKSVASENCPLFQAAFPGLHFLIRHFCAMFELKFMRCNLKILFCKWARSAFQREKHLIKEWKLMSNNKSQRLPARGIRLGLLSRSNTFYLVFPEAAGGARRTADVTHAVESIC
jgi:hypothetical protein